MKLMTAAAAALVFALSVLPVQAQEKPAASMPQNVNRVTVAMMHAAIKGQKDKTDNLVLSPYNALSNMALVGSGAAGSTRDEMARIFFADNGDGFEEQSKALMTLDAEMKDGARGSAELLTASGIWVNKMAVRLKDDYAEDAKALFGAQVSAEDFRLEAAKENINNWADKATKGLIKEIVEELKPQDVIVLATALYFKGQWTSKFDPDLTEQKPFTQDSGKVFNTPMMKREFARGEVTYKKGDGYEAVALTYGDKIPAYMGMGGGEPAIRIILLRPTVAQRSARAFMAAQDATPEWLDGASFEAAEGSVELPHIDITQKHDLILVMKAMGLETPFGSGADFSRMAEGKGSLFISKVSHDVVFRTDEEGSEAAAVTTTTISRTSAIIQEKKRIDVKFDRSFVFALQDIKTGTVIFMGVVNKPNAEMKPAG